MAWIAERCEPNRPLGKKGEVGRAPEPDESACVPV